MSKGTYVLKIKVRRSMTLTVGALGARHFKRGTYFYVGSAMNSLEKRLKRHMSKRKKRRWHVDYLTIHKDVEVIGAYVFPNKRCEESLSEKLSQLCENVKGFGASDMKRVRSNLYLANERAEKLVKDLGGVEVAKDFTGNA